MMSLRTLLLVSALLAPATGIATAQASTLSPLPASCFTYSFGSTSPAAHGFVGTKLHATLPGTPLALDVASVSLTDTSHKVDATTLERFNAAAAYAALSAFHGGLSAACHGQNTTISNRDIGGSTPQARWKGVRLTGKENRELTLNSAEIDVIQAAPDLHVRLSGTGIHSARQPLAPSSVSSDLSIQGVNTAAQQIRINALHAIVGTSTIDGKGTIQPGVSAATSTANVHIEISDIASLIQNVQQTAPAKITTALTIARLMGHNNGTTTSWDIALQGGVVTVNQIPLPIPVH